MAKHYNLGGGGQVVATDSHGAARRGWWTCSLKATLLDRWGV